MLRVVTIIFLLSILERSQQYDFCSQGYCVKKGMHICCSVQSGFASRCPSGIKLLPNTQAAINVVLDEHNKVRETIASGDHGFKKSSRIPVLTWSDELAYTAGCNARSCIDDHDKCRNTETFRYVNQNLYSGYTPDNVTLEMLYTRAVAKWSTESRKTRQSHLDNYQGTSGIGHFTQMIHELAYKIGCAATVWPNGRNTKFYVVCNYNAGNWKQRKVYVTGDLNCSSGASARYPHLCSRNEPPINYDCQLAKV